MNKDFDIFSLSIPECAALAERLWERVYQHPEELKVTPEQMAELDRRLEAFERGEFPPGKSWEEVEAELRKL